MADLSAATEETLSVSGMLLSKTFGQQAASIARFSGLNGGWPSSRSARRWSAAGSS